MRVIPIFFVAALALGEGAAHGHGGHLGAHVPSKFLNRDTFVFGRPGDAARVSTTVQVEVNDRQCRLTTDVRLRQGQTVRFVARNTGTRMHELVLGTSHELAQHAARGAKNPSLDHEELYIVHVEPGATEELVWRFTRVELLRYGCLIYGSGETMMQGRITVTR
jgi:uncharacterized cupredoxin-like copper-binding protein